MKEYTVEEYHELKERGEKPTFEHVIRLRRPFNAIRPCVDENVGYPWDQHDLDAFALDIGQRVIRLLAWEDFRKIEDLYFEQWKMYQNFDHKYTVEHVRRIMFELSEEESKKLTIEWDSKAKEIEDGPLRKLDALISQILNRPEPEKAA